MFNLNHYLAKRSRLVDAVIDRQLPPAREKPVLLHRAMRYSLFSGGKRIRPILCLAAAEATGAPCRRALLPAAAIEMLHTYTLIHDDLPCMDDDDFRRGKPTSHKVFGEANAVLAGDALQALAFELLAQTRVPAPYSPCQLVLELARASGSRGVVGGQVEDLAGAGKRQTRKTVEFIHLHKTADLFSASVRIGAITAGATRSQLAALTLYGRNLGLAFQMTDDILDGVESAAPAVTPEADRELSCLSVFSPEEARKQAGNLIHDAISAIRKLKVATQPLVEIAQFVLDRTH